MTEHQHHSNIALFNRPITHSHEGLSQFKRAKPSTSRDQRRAELIYAINESVEKKLGKMKRVKAG